MYTPLSPATVLQTKSANANPFISSSCLADSSVSYMDLKLQDLDLLYARL